MAGARSVTPIGAAVCAVGGGRWAVGGRQAAVTRMDGARRGRGDFGRPRRCLEPLATYEVHRLALHPLSRPGHDEPLRRLGQVEAPRPGMQRLFQLPSSRSSRKASLSG